MAISSSIRSRRFAARQAKLLGDNQSGKIQHLVIFKLRQEWFAVAVTSVYKVIPFPKLYEAPHHKGVILTNYQDREILVIDVGQKIFGELPQNFADIRNLEAQYLLILGINDNNLIGLPIDSIPSVKRIPESAFMDIPESYLSTGNIHFIGDKMIKTEEFPRVFCLEILKLNNI